MWALAMTINNTGTVYSAIPISHPHLFMKVHLKSVGLFG